MGASVPSDSTAVGTVTVTATESGSITILTRGTEQTSEQLQSPNGLTVAYSNLQATETKNSISTPLSLELAASNRSVAFPLIVIASVLNNPDSCLAYVGLEQVNGLSTHRVRYWNTFNSQPKLQFLTDLTTTDIWIDAGSSLPQRISQTRRSGHGSEPRIALDTFFSTYQNFGGFAYPSVIRKSLNGSPLMTITITNVTFNTGLTDASFPVQ